MTSVTCAWPSPPTPTVTEVLYLHYDLHSKRTSESLYVHTDFPLTLGYIPCKTPWHDISTEYASHKREGQEINLCRQMCAPHYQPSIGTPRLLHNIRLFMATSVIWRIYPPLKAIDLLPDHRTTTVSQCTHTHTHTHTHTCQRHLLYDHPLNKIRTCWQILINSYPAKVGNMVSSY